MSDTFKIKIHCLVLSTDIPNNKKLVLSLDKEKLIIPYFYLTNDNIWKIKENIFSYLQEKIIVSPMELMPSLISVNSDAWPDYIKQENNIINIIYASVIVLTNNLNESYWKEFEFSQLDSYSKILFEVVHTLS